MFFGAAVHGLSLFRLYEVGLALLDSWWFADLYCNLAQHLALLSFATMDLIAIIGGHNHPSIEERLKKYISSIPKPQRLERIQELLVAVSETDELVAEIASKA